MSTGSDLIAMIASRQNLADYQKKHWHGTFAEYLDIVRRDPKVTRTAYQRVYDMILSHGTEEVVVNKEKLVRYKFFDDRDHGGQDAIFGLDKTLMNLVNILKSAAHRYGTERRVLLLHGPVGSSKSTLARLLKKGLERYSKTDEGALYTYGWREEGLDGTDTFADCPMHEEPLHLIPAEHRAGVIESLNAESATPRLPDHDRGRPLPLLPPDVQRADGAVRGRLVARPRRHPRPPPDPLRAGPHRHRHLPAQGREEPGRHRADRRHQLPQDRRVRHRERPPRLQLRRRVQHRQPRHHRVHRGPQARRRLPLRPARAPARSTRSSPRSSPRPTSTR